MNMISCKHCGVVLDKNIIFPHSFKPITGGKCLSEHYTAWDDERQEWVAFVDCPVCKEPILENNS